MSDKNPIQQKSLSRDDFLQIINLLVEYSNKIEVLYSREEVIEEEFSSSVSISYLQNMCEKFKKIVAIASQLQEHYNYEDFPFFPLELDIRLLEAEEVLRQAEKYISSNFRQVKSTVVGNRVYRKQSR